MPAPIREARKPLRSSLRAKRMELLGDAELNARLEAAWSWSGASKNDGRRRCTRVFGQARLAFSNPFPPSVITTSGGAMRAMSAAHACAFSAGCQPITCFSVQAIIITTSRPSQRPSTSTTWWTSSQRTGHRSPELIREMPEGASGTELALGLFESSHLRNSSSSLGSLS